MAKDSCEATAEISDAAPGQGLSACITCRRCGFQGEAALPAQPGTRNQIARSVERVERGYCNTTAKRWTRPQKRTN